MTSGFDPRKRKALKGGGRSCSADFVGKVDYNAEQSRVEYETLLLYGAFFVLLLPIYLKAGMLCHFVEKSYFELPF